jgi:hypothetical protein
VVRVISFASVAGALAIAVGCAPQSREVVVEQPMDFPHAAHISYFASGEHRNQGIKRHLEAFDKNDLPDELKEGRCAECHDDNEMLSDCAACHVRLKNAALWTRKDVRKCVACHREAWGGTDATIPSATTCLPCHKAGVQRARGDDSGPRLVLARAGAAPAGPPVEDVPWMRINVLPGNVYFSHTAHVRYASMACTECHPDTTALTSPPTMVATFTMSRCLNCHAARGASTDCLACHK